MTAREDLAQSIATNLDRMFGKREFGPATQDYDLADALLAEGYRKQQTVTVEELARELFVAHNAYQPRPLSIIDWQWAMAAAALAIVTPDPQR